MLVMEAPQFQTQDDSGLGSGLGPILQWQLASTGTDSQDRTLDDLDVDPAIGNILIRLRRIFRQPWDSRLTNTELHDLTCFVVHRLLLLPLASAANPERSAVSECLRYAMALYMLILHGTTYYSHLNLANTIMSQLKLHLEGLAQTKHIYAPLGIWVLSVGMATTIGTTDRQWLMDRAFAATTALGLCVWDDVLVRLKSILWMGTQQEELFQQKWEEIFKALAK